MILSQPRERLALATHALKKRYGSHMALDGLDLRVPEGVVYGFLGPNGAGKTTTMRVLTGLVRADEGSVEMLGRPYRRKDRTRLFSVGAMIESPSFYPYLSGRANLLALAATGARTNRSRIDELLELVSLRDRADDRVSGYSLGMKQRLGIAGALLSRPKLLLLDEPANGLDPAGIAAMRDLLRRLAADGSTVFVSSHLLGEVQQVADMVGIIAAGRLVREGSVRDLLHGDGTVRIRVTPEEVPRAAAALVGHGPIDGRTPSASRDGWVTVRTRVDGAADVNRRLAEAGIFASHVEAGSDLEQLFLGLTSKAPHADADAAIEGNGGTTLKAATSAEPS